MRKRFVASAMLEPKKTYPRYVPVEVPAREREVDHHQVDGHEPKLVRDHQRAQDEDEQHLAQREAQAGERVAAERGEEAG